MIKIVADSSADLTELPGVFFESVPLSISTRERVFTDDMNLDVSEMMDYLEKYKGRSFTSCPGVSAWLRAFEGSDEILVACLTGHLSGTYSGAMSAASIYMGEHKNARVHVFDTLTTGPELRLFTEKLAELVRNGVPFERIPGEAEEYLRSTRCFFCFESLHNFAQNGRVSKLAASAVGVLNMRIVGTAGEDGNIEPISKCRGDKRAMAEMLKLVEEAGCEGGEIRIGHADNEALALRYAGALKERYPSARILVYPARGLVSYYAERGGILLGIETATLNCSPHA